MNSRVAVLEERINYFSVNYLTKLRNTHRWMQFILLALIILLTGVMAKLYLNLGSYNIPSTHLSILEDTNNSLDLVAIQYQEQQQENNFRPTTAAVTKGYTSSAYWLKIDPSYLPADNYLLSLNYSALDKATLYLPSAEGVETLVAGLQVPREEWPLATTDITFPVTIASGMEPLYLKLQSSYAVQATVELIPRDNLNWTVSQMLWGAFYGCLLIMFLYNANLYFGTGESPYFFYSLHTLAAAFAFATLSGHGYILWPGFPEFDTYSISVGVSLFWIVSLQFSRIFLRLGNVSRRLDWLMIGFMAAWFAILSVAVVGQLNLSTMTTPFSIVSCVLLIAAGVRCLHYPFARYFILAWSAYLVGIVVICLGFLGILPRNVFTVHAGEWGQIFEIVVLAFALADQMKTLREENLLAVEAREQTAKDLLDMTQRRFTATLESAEIKDRFLSTLSHEMRTPMHGILTPLEHIKDLNPSNEVKESLDLSIKCAHDMKQMLDRLLRLSDLEAGRLRLDDKPLDLITSISMMTPLFRHRCSVKGIRFTYVLGKNVPRFVIADGNNLLELLRIFLDNAVKFTSEGGVHLAIVQSETLSTQSETVLDFFISDSGVGFDNKTATNLFSKFLQADGSANRKYGGLGIDLAVAQNIVTQMHGEINFSSVKHRGSLFHIRLGIPVAEHGEIITFDDGLSMEKLIRRAEEGQTSVAEEGRKKDVAKDKPAGYELPVLIVEDDTTNQLIAKTIVAKMGFDVMIANNGVEALEHLERNRFCLVLMDCQMPVKDGYQTTREIRESVSSYRSIPIIALTANAMEGDKQKCLEAGMDDYLSKPFTPDAIRERISYWAKLPGSHTNKQQSKTLSPNLLH